MKHEISKQIAIRTASSGDLGFIIKSWVNSNFAGSVLARRQGKKTYYPAMYELVRRFIDRGEIAVACSLDDPDHVLGFMAYEFRDQGLCVHYIYVKGSFRKLKVGQFIFDTICQSEPDQSKKLSYSHVTDSIKFLTQARLANFNPYQFYFAEGALDGGVHQESESHAIGGSGQGPRDLLLLS